MHRGDAADRLEKSGYEVDLHGEVSERADERHEHVVPVVRKGDDDAIDLVRSDDVRDVGRRTQHRQGVHAAA